MTRIINTMGLSDKFTFGKFLGMPVREAIERDAKHMLRMKNTGHFKLDEEALTYLKDELL
jgi:hypothetical protein